MGRKQIMSKRNRVCSLERNKLLRFAFAKKYVDYLEPVLKKIKDEKSSSNHNQNGKVINVSKLVRFEVDMAMVMSASKDFAWSRSLKAQLQHYFASRLSHPFSTSCSSLKDTGIVEEKVSNDESSLALTLSPCCNTSLMPLMNNNILEIPKMMMSKQSSSRRLMQVSEGTSSKEETNYENEEEEEEESVKSRLAHLRKLLPGGNEIGDIELLTELESYITCLQLQVNILDCLCGSGN